MQTIEILAYETSPRTINFGDVKKFVLNILEF